MSPAQQTRRGHEYRRSAYSTGTVGIFVYLYLGKNEMTNYNTKPVMDGRFLRKTNADYIAWCATYYRPDSLDEHGMAGLHGLWAWQEQERRFAALMAEKDARIAELEATLGASCDDERSQLFEAGSGGGCDRALDAERERDQLRLQLAEAQAGPPNVVSDEYLTRIYKAATNETEGKGRPISTESIFRAMRAAITAAVEPYKP